MIKIFSKDLSSSEKKSIAAQVKAAKACGLSWNQIHEQCGIPTTTLKRWAGNDMSVKGQKERQEHQRRSLLLEPVEEFFLLTRAKIRRSRGKVVDLEWTRKTIALITLGRVASPSDAYMVKFWAAHGWRCRKAVQRSPREMRPTLDQEVADFRKQVESYIEQNQIPASNVFMMDETGLWNGNVCLKTYVDPETMDNGVIQCSKNQRDTGVVAISATGVVFPQFIRHTPQKTKMENGKKVVVQPGVSEMNIALMKEFANNFAKKFANGNEIILMFDNLRARLNQEVQMIFASYNIKTFPIPPHSAKFLSVCDNSFLHSLKERLRKEDTTTFQKKELTFLRICQEYPVNLILNFWKHCGWNFFQ